MPGFFGFKNKQAVCLSFAALILTRIQANGVVFGDDIFDERLTIFDAGEWQIVHHSCTIVSPIPLDMRLM